MRPLAAALSALLVSCASAAVREPLPDRRGDGPAAALGLFVAAAQDGRWEEAYGLLSARWRARTTPARLRLDWKASGPVGAEACARVSALLQAGAGLEIGPRQATLAVGEGRRARVVAEPGGWRVDSLE